MKEREWTKSLVKEIEKYLKAYYPNVQVKNEFKLPYASEILNFKSIDMDKYQINFIGFKTDILISEHISEEKWKPRIIIEVKINKITTHDSITYSHKAILHKNVYPYLRYGVLLGNLKEKTLPGRLFRHGQHFDFMISFKSFKYTKNEWNELIDILKLEFEASKNLEEIIFNSRKKKRDKFISLHKPLILNKQS